MADREITLLRNIDTSPSFDEQIPSSVQSSCICGPPFQDLVSAIPGLVTAPSLMSVFLASLEIERLHQQFAAFNGIHVNAIQQRSIVLPDVGCSQEFGSPLRGLQLH